MPRFEQQHADTSSDYLKLVPGLQINESTPGSSRLIVRGVNSGGVASTDGVYVDETRSDQAADLPMTRCSPETSTLLTWNGIEVLRGPQATIYGASSLTACSSSSPGFQPLPK
ncbi:Plug domain-containing protein [uncultured Sphingomonas sp.]|uniref:Plug domain-containing protein n=1 Tax=uncultured Sphingomonas sp. TaxID=158754 RepID=UPI0025CDA080|nr:Plug domain-containing protein [uncultured Sphingomonas sp.]